MGVNMKVSIVIPCYNHKEYIKESINSALNQTYEDKEIIVVNDGSTDESLQVIQEYKDKITIIDQPNAGLSRSRNVGFAAASGDAFLPLDADDYIAPTYLERTVPLLNDPKVGIVATDMQYFGEGNSLIPAYNVELEEEKYSNNIPVCSLIRRQAFEQANKYEDIFVLRGKKICGYEDWELWIDILKHGWKVASVNEILFFYRIKPVSMVTEADTVRHELIEEIRKRHSGLF